MNRNTKETPGTLVAQKQAAQRRDTQTVADTSITLPLVLACQDRKINDISAKDVCYRQGRNQDLCRVWTRLSNFLRMDSTSAGLPSVASEISPSSSAGSEPVHWQEKTHNTPRGVDAHPLCDAPFLQGDLVEIGDCSYSWTTLSGLPQPYSLLCATPP